MKRIPGFDELPQNEVVEFEKLKVGAYICQIKSVEDVEDKEYLKIKFDIVDGEYKNWFNDMSQGNLDNWSSQGTTYRSYKDTATRFFKAFITAIEKSNAKSNFRWNWDEKTLVGKYFVAVYGEEEYEDQFGDVKVNVKVQDIRSIPALREGAIKLPELKKLKTKSETKPETNNYKGIDISDDDLPF